MIEYPTIDAPTRETFEGQLGQQQSQPQEEPQETRELQETREPPTPTATIEVPVVGEVELPPVAPLVTAGVTAVVTTAVVLISNILLGQLKRALDGPLKRLLEPKKKKKVKLKQKKPILHYVREEDKVNIFEYSVKGTKLITTTDKPEQYIRDQVEMSTVYEYDNKLIINDDIEEMFTKEGANRFKKHFTPAKSIVKKLSAKFSF